MNNSSVMSLRADRVVSGACTAASQWGPFSPACISAPPGPRRLARNTSIVITDGPINSDACDPLMRRILAWRPTIGPSGCDASRRCRLIMQQSPYSLLFNLRPRVTTLATVLQSGGSNRGIGPAILPCLLNPCLSPSILHSHVSPIFPRAQDLSYDEQTFSPGPPPTTDATTRSLASIMASRVRPTILVSPSSDTIPRASSSALCKLMLMSLCMTTAPE